MAVFLPTLEEIYRFKVPPTEGERTLLEFLKTTLSNEFEVYFNPFLNGDRPDVVIMRKNYGALIIEVKDWNLDKYYIDKNKKWKYNNNIIKSPIDQVLKYKENLYNLHIPNLLQLKINDIKYFNCVKCGIYFHCASQKKVNEKIEDSSNNAEDQEFQEFLKYNIRLIGRDNLNPEYFQSILQWAYLDAKNKSYYFTDEIYNNFKRILSPSIHLKEQGKYDITFFIEEQLAIILSDKLEQRIRGVFGSGKTTTLAAKAVQAYKKALNRTNNPKILILTYNITLRNFIRDKINAVREEFNINNFFIINYHEFINIELNNLGIDIMSPDTCNKEDISTYFEKYYYSNISLFEEHKNKILKYDAVFIDEIQDYRREWMEIIKNYFRDPEGDYILFGDVKQNIYGLPIKEKDVHANVQRVKTLKICHRSDTKIIDLATNFQTKIFQDKYIKDNFDDYKQLELNLKKNGYIDYIYIEKNKYYLRELYDIIRKTILNKNNNISPNDITVLCTTINSLRSFDAYYRYISREKCLSMAETLEVMYRTNIDYIGSNSSKEDYNWFNSIYNKLEKTLFSNRKGKLFDKDKGKIKNYIAQLFTIYDMWMNYKEDFDYILEEKCNKCKITKQKFLEYRGYYKETIDVFKNKVYRYDYEYIRKNKKFHFEMNCGSIKASTIHSFKGWESEVLFLIIDPFIHETFDELIYTGITRCKRNLLIINMGNVSCDIKLSSIIKNQA